MTMWVGSAGGAVAVDSAVSVPFFDFETMKLYLGDEHACSTTEVGWHPCPFWLCERPDHKHDICPECHNDLITFMHEQNCSRSWPDNQDPPSEGLAPG